MTMKMSIRPVDQSNWREIVALKPRDDQKAFIEPNEISILESFFDRKLKWKCYGLYEDETPVGFLMIGAMSRLYRYIWIDRFMIDAAYQGNRRGTDFLAYSLGFIASKFPVKTIKTSIIPGNTVMAHVFQTNGFTPTGTIDPEFDEEVLIYKVKRRKKRNKGS